MALLLKRCWNDVSSRVENIHEKPVRFLNTGERFLTNFPVNELDVYEKAVEAFEFKEGFFTIYDTAYGGYPVCLNMVGWFGFYIGFHNPNQLWEVIDLTNFWKLVTKFKQEKENVKT